MYTYVCKVVSKHLNDVGEGEELSSMFTTQLLVRASLDEGHGLGATRNKEHTRQGVSELAV